MLTSITFWGIVAAVVLIVGVTIRMNVLGAKQEHAISERRGKQVVSDFASLFSDEVEQRAARELFEPLQSLTFSHSYSFSPDDELFGYDTVFQALTIADPRPIPPLKLDDEDLADEIERVLGRLGIPKKDIDWGPFQSMKTVGDLVVAVATVVRARNPRAARQPTRH